MRPSPDSAALRLAFTRTERRTQRRSDGTVVIDTRRFEVPNAFRHVDRVLVRYARWDLSQVHPVDEHSGQISARLYPLDKSANANGIRRPLEPVATRAFSAPVVLSASAFSFWMTAAASLSATWIRCAAAESCVAPARATSA